MTYPQFEGRPNKSRAEYVYVASSWRNPMQPAVIAVLAASGVPHYDFRHEGFRWDETGLSDPNHQAKYWDYQTALAHPRAREGFNRDMVALDRASHVLLILPCGRSSHLELGWAVGKKKETAILFEPGLVVAELMYKMVDVHLPGLSEMFDWLGVPQ